MPKIAAVSIYVKDIEAAVKFYTVALGFAVRARPNPFIVELDHDTPALVLCQAEQVSASEYPTGTGTVVGIATRDVTEAAKSLAGAGATMRVGTPQPFPGGRFIAVEDPSGNVVELLQFE